MALPHPWFECKPILLLGEDIPDEPDPTRRSAVDQVWRLMDDGRRHRFHKFTCEGDREPRTLVVIYEFRLQLAKRGIE